MLCNPLTSLSFTQLLLNTVDDLSISLSVSVTVCLTNIYVLLCIIYNTLRLRSYYYEKPITLYMIVILASNFINFITFVKSAQCILFGGSCLENVILLSVVQLVELWVKCMLRCSCC